MADEEAIKLGGRVKAARKHSEMTAQQLADALGVSRPTIVAYEAGSKMMSAVTLIRMARILRVPVAYLGGEQASPIEGAWTAADEIRRARLAAGLSQEALAAIIDVDRAMVSRWETGERAYSNQQRVRLEKALGVSLKGATNHPDNIVRLLSFDVPKVWPDHLMAFICSVEKRTEVPPLQVPLLAAMSGHDLYWEAESLDDWAELWDALQRDIKGAEFSVWVERDCNVPSPAG